MATINTCSHMASLLLKLLFIAHDTYKDNMEHMGGIDEAFMPALVGCATPVTTAAGISKCLSI
jgi:hypothetical protein